MIKRLFIGVPVQTGKAVQAAQTWKNDTHLNRNQFVWSRPENWHITLYFLGNTDILRIDLLQKLIEESFAGVASFQTDLSGVGVFPDTGHPKVLWLGLTDIQPLMPAYSALGELLLENGFSFDQKPLKPHLTLARIKRTDNLPAIQELIARHGKSGFGMVDISKIALFESLSTPNGPVYKPLFMQKLR